MRPPPDNPTFNPVSLGLLPLQSFTAPSGRWITWHPAKIFVQDQADCPAAD
jgi:hypothetical protein